MGAHPALHLVQAVDRDAQDLAGVVLDHQRLDRFPADDDPLQPAKPADSVLHVDDVVAGRQLGQALQRGRPAKTPAAAELAIAAEDLVIGENIGGRLGVLHAKPARERADHQVAAARQPPATVRDEVLEAPGLPVVVAQDEGVGAARGRVRQERPQALHVALENGGAAGLEDDVSDVLLHQGEAPVPGHALGQFVGREEEVGGGDGGIVIAQRPAVARLGPAPQPARAFVPGIGAGADQDRVHGQTVENGARRATRPFGAATETHGQDVDALHGSGGTLIEDVEETNRLDLVPRELDPRGTRGAEREQVDQAPADGVATGLLDHRGALEAAFVEGGDEGVAAKLAARRDGEAQVGEVVGDGGQFLECSPRGHQDARPPGQDGLHRFHSLALGIGPVLLIAGGGVPLLGKERGRLGTEQRFQVGQVSARLGGRRRDDNPDAVGKVRDQGGQHRQGK